ncbi:MAG: GAF domain-containing protein [Anaerolineae bacterium]|nr:GAF domain-containing protein [Anaerolineae bacterium]
MTLNNLPSFFTSDYRVRQRDSLLEISRALTEELDIDALLKRILRISIEMLSGQAGLIALRSEKAVWGIRVSQGLTPEFMRSVQPIFADIPSGAPVHDEAQDAARQQELVRMNQRLQQLVKQASMGLLTGVGLPMVTRERVVGMIFIFRGYQNNFSQNDLDVLNSFANQAAIAVQNAQLYTEVIREKQRVSALLEAVGDGILILTPAHVIEIVNHSMMHLLGLEKQDITGRTHEDLIRWRLAPKGVTLPEAEAGGWPLNERAVLYVEGDILRFDDNASIPVGITYAPLFSEQGILQNIIVSVRDITRFRQADELKSTFVSIISHELKTPVALIKGYVSTLRISDAEWDLGTVQEGLQVIEDEADRLTELIDNLLDASRFEAGGFKINRSDVYLPLLVQKVCDSFTTQTEAHTFVVDFPVDFPVVLADENRIRQVINNLVSNAIKYAPAGEIRLGGVPGAEGVTVCVSDHGPGIAPNDRQQIFERFFRAPEAARHTKGAGLGLYLTRQIIEAHGGEIWVDASYDQGTRICFTLPLEPAG